MIPEDDQKHNDAIDFVIDTMKEVEEIHNDDGTTTKNLVFNPDIAWFKGHRINKPFGRCALFIKRLEHIAKMCKNFMYEERAKEMEKGLLMIVEEYKRSIDAKSSETIYDQNNKQQALVDVLSKNKSERVYTVKGEAKKSIWDAITGKDKNKEEED